MSKPTLFIGIDPQPTLLGVCGITSTGKIVFWEPVWFQKKSTFKHVQLWQEYIISECLIELKKIQVTYPQYELYISVEQQRGRINSMIEHTIVTLCYLLKLKCKVFHSKTWKSIINFESAKGNRNNKEHSEFLCKDIIDKDFPHFNDYERKHDLCDGYLIAKALCKLKP